MATAYIVELMNRHTRTVIHSAYVSVKPKIGTFKYRRVWLIQDDAKVLHQGISITQQYSENRRLHCSLRVSYQIINLVVFHIILCGMVLVITETSSNSLVSCVAHEATTCI